MFAANQTHEQRQKDSAANAEQTGNFCWNMATYDLRDAVNASAEFLDPSVDEFKLCGLEKEEARTMPVSMVAESPIRFECKYYSTLRLPGNPPQGSVDVVIGRVVAVHISEGVLTDGMIDLAKAMPIARCGYYQYAVVRGENIFEMKVPGNAATLVGLEGSVKGSRVLEEEQRKKRDKKTVA